MPAAKRQAKKGGESQRKGNKAKICRLEWEPQMKQTRPPS